MESGGRGGGGPGGGPGGEPGGEPEADKGAAAGEVSDPCCLAAPAAGAAPAVGLAAMAERERGPVGAEGRCRCCEEATTTSVIFGSVELGGRSATEQDRPGLVGKRMGARREARANSEARL